MLTATEPGSVIIPVGVESTPVVTVRRVETVVNVRRVETEGHSLPILQVRPLLRLVLGVHVLGVIIKLERDRLLLLGVHALGVIIERYRDMLLLLGVRALQWRRRRNELDMNSAAFR